MTRENRLVVASKAWAETIPEWLLEEVKSERLMLGLLNMARPESVQEVGNAEACVYLYTLGLEVPIHGAHAEIYIYLGAKLAKRRGKQLAPFMEEKLQKGLTPDEERELKDLKGLLYTKRGGEIVHPLLDALRELKKGTGRKPEPEAKVELVQFSLADFAKVKEGSGV